MAKTSKQIKEITMYSDSDEISILKTDNEYIVIHTVYPVPGAGNRVEYKYVIQPGKLIEKIVHRGWATSGHGAWDVETNEFSFDTIDIIRLIEKVLKRPFDEIKFSHLEAIVERISDEIWKNIGWEE